MAAAVATWKSATWASNLIAKILTGKARTRHYKSIRLLVTIFSCHTQAIFSGCGAIPTACTSITTAFRKVLVTAIVWDPSLREWQTKKLETRDLTVSAYFRFKKKNPSYLPLPLCTYQLAKSNRVKGQLSISMQSKLQRLNPAYCTCPLGSLLSRSWGRK